MQGGEREGGLAEPEQEPPDPPPDRAGLDAHERSKLDERPALVIHGPEQGAVGWRYVLGQGQNALVRHPADGGGVNMTRTTGLDIWRIGGKIGI